MVWGTVRSAHNPLAPCLQGSFGVLDPQLNSCLIFTSEASLVTPRSPLYPSILSICSRCFSTPFSELGQSDKKHFLGSKSKEPPKNQQKLCWRPLFLHATKKTIPDAVFGFRTSPGRPDISNKNAKTIYCLSKSKVPPPTNKKTNTIMKKKRKNNIPATRASLQQMEVLKNNYIQNDTRIETDKFRESHGKGTRQTHKQNNRDTESERKRSQGRGR